MILYLLAIGAISILAQVVLLRELGVAFYGVELIYILGMGIWLLGTAIGAAWKRESLQADRVLVRSLLIAFALLLPADVVLIRLLRKLFGAIPGSYLPFAEQLAGLLTVLLPVGVLLGLLFQWSAKIFIGESRTLAMAYAVECAGAVAGGLASTLLLKFGIQNFAIAIVCSLSVLLFLLFPLSLRKQWHWRLSLGLVPIFLVLLYRSPSLDLALTRVNHPAVVETRDSPYSRITVSRQEEQLVFFENDVLSFETESVSAEELVHLPALQLGELRTALILGGSFEGLLREVLKHSPEKVDVVELNPVLLDLAELHLPGSFGSQSDPQRVSTHIADPRAFLMETPDRYELILVGMPAPESGQSNRFYTSEFFRRCARVLEPAGLLAIRLPSSENVWTRSNTYRNASIYQALSSAFSDVQVLPGTSAVFIASQGPLVTTPEQMGQRLERRGIQTRLVHPQYINYLYSNDRFQEIRGRLEDTTIEPNSDVQPICYRYSSMIWLSKFFPSLINWDLQPGRDSSWSRSAGLALTFLGLSGLAWFARKKGTWRRAMLVGLAGFSGMVLETVLILHYQVKSGILFQNIGILLMIFMTGLSLGSFGVARFLSSRRRDSLGLRRLWGIALVACFAVLGLSFIALVRVGSPETGFLQAEFSGNLLVVSLLLFGTGFLVAGLFAYASLSGVTDQKAAVSPLYSADLLGGCVGALVAGLFLIPFWGLELSTLGSVLMILAGLLLV